jgi:hypothetical protein
MADHQRDSRNCPRKKNSRMRQDLSNGDETIEEVVRIRFHQDVLRKLSKAHEKIDIEKIEMQSIKLYESDLYTDTTNLYDKFKIYPDYMGAKTALKIYVQIYLQGRYILAIFVAVRVLRCGRKIIMRISIRY